MKKLRNQHNITQTHLDGFGVYSSGNTQKFCNLCQICNPETKNKSEKSLKLKREYETNKKWLKRSSGKDNYIVS